MINIYNWRFKALLYVLMQVEYIGYVTPYGEHHRYYIIRYYLPYLQQQVCSFFWQVEKKKTLFTIKLIPGGCFFPFQWSILNGKYHRVHRKILYQRGLFITSYIFEKAGNISNLIVQACSNTEETVRKDDFEIVNSLIRCILHGSIRINL